MPDIEGVPYETTGTPLDQASAQALAARYREAISAGVAAGTEAKALAQSVVAEVGTIRTAVVQSANSASAAAGSAAQAEQTATDLVPRMEQIETMAGLAPGEVTDAQTANLISRADTSTRDALNAATDDRTTQKMIHGGALLRPVRVPTLIPGQSYPNERMDGEVVWADDATNTVYLKALDNTVYKTTDGGKTWAKRGRITLGVSNGAFLRTASGALLAPSAANPPAIQRSTDDGATWAVVHTMRTGTVAMGTQSWSQNPTTGYIYLGEYQASDTGFTEIRVSYSTDDGATWTTLHAFPGPATAAASKVRHIHSIVTDPIDKRTYVLTGDSETASGIYRVSADGHSLSPWLTNADIPDLPDAARSIGMMFFPTHIAWGIDGSTSAIMRVPRATADAPVGHHEYIYRLNSTAWFTIRASTDNTRWLISASNESGPRIDKSVHLYAVEDGGATVYEVAAVASDSSAIAAVAPVGQAETHGDTFWLKGHGYGLNYWATRARLSYAASDSLTPPDRPQTPLITRDSGFVTLTSTVRSVEVATIQGSAYWKWLEIYDIGVSKNQAQNLYIRLWNKTTGAAITEVNNIYRDSERHMNLQGGAPYLWKVLVNAATIGVQIYHTGSATDLTGTGFVTYRLVSD